MRHAPDRGNIGKTIWAARTLCSSTSDDPEIVEPHGATINCQPCLTKLHKLPQYLNVLMEAGYVIGKRRMPRKRKPKVDERQLDLGDTQ